jgi:hypothetical protein
LGITRRSLDQNARFPGAAGLGSNALALRLLGTLPFFGHSGGIGSL